MPAIFVSHGAPTLPLEESSAREFLAQLGGELPRPRAILAISAHWDTAQPVVSAAARPATIHDFHGFPAELYRLRYPAPGAPELARRVAELLGAGGLATEIVPDRGPDHGAWVPLLLMYPEADIPVTQLSIQSRLGPAHHLRLGEALQPLREEGVLILASGGATHNLREWRDQRENTAPLLWVVEFKEWLAEAVLADRREELVAYRTRAPHAVRNHPTDEHLIPLFVALGARRAGGSARRLHTSVASGVLSMDTYRFD